MKNRSFTKKPWRIHPIAALKNRIPNKGVDYLDVILWNCTAFPLGSKYMVLRQAVYSEEMGKHGISVCFRCGNPYRHPSGRVWIDQPCEDCKHESIPDSRQDRARRIKA